MKVLVLGDLFVTCDLMKEALEEAFRDSGISFEYTCYTDRWPVEPLQHNDEVREFVGCDEEIAAQASDAEIILTPLSAGDPQDHHRGSELKAVAAARGGPVNINVQACSERGIPVFYAPGSKSRAVAEFTVALTLALSRNVVRSHVAMVQSGQWRGDLYVFEQTGPGIDNTTVGLIGLGAIGSRVAELLACFGAKILVYDPYVPATAISLQGYTSVGLEEVLQRADIVSLHARLTPETRGMLGERELGLMKPSALLINTARAELVDETALHDALAGGKIRGAALDVFSTEPLPPNHPLMGLENVILTSHLGGASVHAARLGAHIMADQVFKFLTALSQPEHCMNPDVFRQGMRAD